MGAGCVNIANLSYAMLEHRVAGLVGDVQGDSIKDSAAIAFVTLRRAIPYISDHTLVRHVLLRRRWEEAEMRGTESLESSPPIVCLRVKLPRHFARLRRHTGICNHAFTA